MPDFDERLAELARHAETTGRLDPAAAVRARADHRRRRRTLAVAGFGVAVAVALTAGIAIAQPQRHEPTMVPAPWVSTVAPAPAATLSPTIKILTPPSPARPSSAQPSSAPSSLSRSAELDRLRHPPGLSQVQAGFDYRRAYRIVLGSGPGEVGVMADGRVDLVDQGSVFTTTTDAPDGNEWLIRVDEKGGSRCLSVQADATIGTRKCNPSDTSQRLRYYRAGTDAQGHPTYVIGFGLDVISLSGERFLGTTPADHHARLGMVAGPREQVAAEWSFVDQGPSTLGG